jgi:hypothetical protein
MHRFLSVFAHTNSRAADELTLACGSDTTSDLIDSGRRSDSLFRGGYFRGKQAAAWPDMLEANGDMAKRFMASSFESRRGCYSD